MIEVKEILNFTLTKDVFELPLKNALPSERLISSRISKLNLIAEAIGKSSFVTSKRTLLLIPQVVKQFKNNFHKGKIPLDNFGKQELRTLTYSLSHPESNYSTIFSKPSELDFAFETLNSNWKDSYIIGLIRCQLENWESENHTSIEKLSNFIDDKMKSYQGSSKKLQSYKSNKKFFNNRNGNVLLGLELALKNININGATKHLTIPDDWFTYPYFSKVILTYYVKRKNDVQHFIDNLNTAFVEHNNSITDRRVISQLVIQANKPEFISVKETVKRIALERLLDPQRKDSIWHPFEGATESEISDLRTAKKIVLQWIAEQFINVFFEKCINDIRRKRFWLKYAKEISDFRVVGSTAIKRILMNDVRISEVVLPRFIKTNSNNDRNAALMFILRTHLFIEFSDEGAFYAYKLSNPNAPSIEKEHFISTANLKTPSMPLLLYRNGNDVTRTNEEGRLPHNSQGIDWEDVAKYWIERKVGINV